jgi:hypothetical protein
MATAIEAIAARVQAAETEGFAAGRRTCYELLADEVDLHRVPAWPEDGLRSKSQFLESWLMEADVLSTAITNFHQEDVETSIEGDTIRLLRSLCGTTADGTPVRVPIVNVLTIDDGRISGLEVHVTPTDRDFLRDVIVSAGGDHVDFATDDDDNN